MADDYMALADLTIINDNNVADIDVRDLFDRAPLMAALNAVTASNGTVHKYFKTTGAPVVGFRDYNDGREHDSTVRTAVTIDLKVFDCSFTVDTAVARSYKGGEEALIRLEAIEALRAGFFKLEQQVLNGTEAAGFDGLADIYNTGAECINAGGSTACSSVYLIRSGLNDVSIVAGNSGQLTIGESVLQRVPGATGHFMAYVTEIMALYGLQIGSQAKSAIRICNLNATDKTLTDDLLYDAMAAFESGSPPTHIVMNRRSAQQLRKSRTATNATGAPAPVPVELEGIPIVISDAIGNAETAVT
jgi:hypothetical protein